MTATNATVQEVSARLRYAQRVLFITGAGISADSGLPTYRGVGGLYDSDLTHDGMPIEVALSGAMMDERPDITWKYLHEIERRCRGAVPNAAHRVIADIEQHLPYALTFTQNVDGLHVQAGTRHLVEIHGNLHHLRCTRCDYQQQVTSFADLGAVPQCPCCGSNLRPAVVLFGEALPEAGIDTLYDALDEGFDMVFSIGTSSQFPYIAAPVAWAQRNRVAVVEINPGETPVSHLADFIIREGAAAAMERIGATLRW